MTLKTHGSDEKPDKPVNGPDITQRSPTLISSASEVQVQEFYHKWVRAKCAGEIRDFAACTINKTFSATWKCRTQRRTMNSCMMSHATQAEQDAARTEYFATIENRRAERARKEAEKKEAEKFYRKWWDLDERERKASKLSSPE